MLEKFDHYKGLSLNSNKSKIFFSKGFVNKEDLKTTIGFTESPPNIFGFTPIPCIPQTKTLLSIS